MHGKIQYIEKNPNVAADFSYGGVFSSVERKIGKPILGRFFSPSIRPSPT